jgi:hypothetical protein
MLSICILANLMVWLLVIYVHVSSPWAVYRHCNATAVNARLALQRRTKRAYGLDVSDKRVRVASYHQKTLDATVKLLEACGYEKLSEIDPAKIFRKVDQYHTRSFSDIYFPGNASYKDNWPPVRSMN